MKTLGKRIVGLWLVFTLVITMALASFASAETASSTASFKDVKQSDWFNPYVNKMSILGIVSGKGDNKFDPSGDLTRQEAVSMIARMLGLDISPDPNISYVFLLKTDEWAKPALRQAILKGVIKENEELALPGDWGTGKATREWVTKLIVRALGKQAEADSAKSDVVNFTDKSLMDPNNYGYINVGQKLGFISGNPDGTFKPKDKILRAQMASMLSRAETLLPARSSSISIGTISEKNNQLLNIVGSDGMTKTFTIDATTVVLDEKFSPTSTTQLVPTTRVAIISSNGVAKVIELNAVGSQSNSITGTFISISKLDQLISLKVGNEPKTYTYKADVTVMKPDGTSSDLNSLVPESVLELRRNSEDLGGQVTSIIIKSMPLIQTVEGTIKSISLDSARIELTLKGSDLTSIYAIPSTATLRSDAKTLQLSDLHVGDEVKIQLKNNVLTDLEVTKSSIKTIAAKISDINAKEKKISIPSVENTDITYKVDANVQVVITGLARPELTDVQKDDEVILELNSSNIVQKITVKNRSISTLLGLTIEYFNSKTNKVLLTSKDVDNYFELVDNSQLVFENETVPVDKFSTYFTVGKKVDITYTGERIVSMRLSSKYTGIVKELNTTARTIKISTDVFGDMTFNYTTTPAVYAFKQSNAGLNNIGNGSEVQIELDSNQDKVKAIHIAKDVLYRVKSVTTSTNSMRAIDESGYEDTLYVISGVTLTHSTIYAPRVSDIVEGDIVIATYVGASTVPTKVHVAGVTRGAVTAVNGTSNSITVNEYNKSSKTISTASGVQVIRNGQKSSSITTLVTGDRIEVIEKADKSLQINVLEAISRKMFGVSGNTFEVYRNTISENNKFTAASNIYVHQGTTTLSLSSLKKDDQVTFYVINGLVVEIEKK